MKGPAMRTLLSSLFVGRFCLALLVVFAFYNIFGVSFYHWVVNTPFEGLGSPAGFGKIAVGSIFFAAFVFFLYSTWRAPAKFVYLTLLAIVMAVIWWANLLGLYSLADPSIGTIMAQVLIAFALALGSIWGIVWRGRTGQQSVDDPDTGN